MNKGPRHIRSVDSRVDITKRSSSRTQDHDLAIDPISKLTGHRVFKADDARHQLGVCL